MGEDARVKVLFRESDGHVETLWATSLGGDRYRLDNCPWFAYGVSWQDVVEARYSDEEERITFVRVAEKSGNRTLRVLFEAQDVESGRAKEVLERIVALGCSYEGANPKYIAVNLPPEADFGEVCEYLVSADVRWEHADPTCRELYGEDG